MLESFKPNYSESICYVSELPSRESHDPQWDGSNRPPGGPGAPAPREHSPYQNNYVGV